MAMPDMEIRISKGNTIHLHNSASYGVHVIAVPNSAWIKADITYSMFTLVNGLPSAINTVMQAKSLFDIARLYVLATTSYKLFSKPLQHMRMLSSNQVLQDALARNRARIDGIQTSLREGGQLLQRGKTVALTDKAILSGVLFMAEVLWDNTKLFKQPLSRSFQQVCDAVGVATPSKLAAMLSDVADTTILVVSEDFTRVCAFNSNSDHSWIVQEDRIVRAKYGELDVPAPELGMHIFGRERGMVLSGADEEYLEPGDCLVGFHEGKTCKLLLQTDGDLVLYQDGAAPAEPEKKSDWVQAGETACSVAGWALAIVSGGIAGVAQKAAGEYAIDTAVSLAKGGTYQPAQAVWSSGTAGNVPYRACMRQDGNFVLYGQPRKLPWEAPDTPPEAMPHHKVLWAAFDTPPATMRHGNLMLSADKPVITNDQGGVMHAIDTSRKESTPAGWDGSWIALGGAAQT